MKEEAISGNVKCSKKHAELRKIEEEVKSNEMKDCCEGYRRFEINASKVVHRTLDNWLV